jgi:hypothetical protein
MQTEKVLKARYFHSVGVAPDEEVRECELGDDGGRPGEELIKNRFIVYADVPELREFGEIPQRFIHRIAPSFLGDYRARWATMVQISLSLKGL